MSGGYLPQVRMNFNSFPDIQSYVNNMRREDLPYLIRDAKYNLLSPDLSRVQRRNQQFLISYAKTLLNPRDYNRVRADNFAFNRRRRMLKPSIMETRGVIRANLKKNARAKSSISSRN